MAKRPLAWGDTHVQQALVTATQVNLDLLLALTPSDTVTVTRIIGRLAVYSDDLDSVADSGMRIDIGIQVVTAQAFAAGGASVPSVAVATETPARGWLMKDRLLFMQAVGTDPLNRFRIPEAQYDIGAMRKVDRGKLILSLHSTIDLTAGINLRVVGLIRALCMT